MELQLVEIEKALDAGLYLIALQASLTLPDICGALESDDGKANRQRYISWYDNYAKEQEPFSISGADCYFFRCSYLHQGSTAHHKSTYSRIMFLIPNEKVVIKNCIFNDALCIDVISFCKNIIQAVRKWEIAVHETDNYKRNRETLIKIYPDGLSPFMNLQLPIVK